MNPSIHKKLYINNIIINKKMLDKNQLREYNNYRDRNSKLN